MSNQRIEIISTLTEYEKKLLREFFTYDRTAKLYESTVGDCFKSHREAMMRMRRTFDVRHTHVDEEGRECPCFSSRRKHARID